jgi:hypothetical protein
MILHNCSINRNTMSQIIACMESACHALIDPIVVSTPCEGICYQSGHLVKGSLYYSVGTPKLHIDK